jgi:hypothetical protein
MFTIEVDKPRQLLLIGMTGFWTQPVMDAYLNELRNHSSAMRASGGLLRVLVDMAGYPIQAQPIADGHAGALEFAERRIGAQVALVVPSTLARMQVGRVAQSTGHRVFTERSAALTWLMAPRDS